ncbi:MAG TPA: DUF2231 domain-containing protein [Bacteroidota bacterium]|nr:DUF2231 domain-containing protein [Bacteroidota bacterium]
MPPLHPFFVHFPVALLTVGFCADVCAVVLRRASAAQRVGWWNLIVGTAGLVAAVLSGLVAKAEVGVRRGIGAATGTMPEDGFLAAADTGPGSDSAASAASNGFAVQAADTLAAHEQFAFMTIAAFLLLLYWRIRNKTEIPPALPRLYLLLYGACIVLLWCTAWFGGELVYLFGVGVLGNTAP